MSGPAQSHRQRLAPALRIALAAAVTLHVAFALSLFGVLPFPDALFHDSPHIIWQGRDFSGKVVAGYGLWHGHGAYWRGNTDESLPDLMQVFGKLHFEDEMPVPVRLRDVESRTPRETAEFRARISLDPAEAEALDRRYSGQRGLITAVVATSTEGLGFGVEFPDGGAVEGLRIGDFTRTVVPGYTPFRFFPVAAYSIPLLTALFHWKVSYTLWAVFFELLMAVQLWAWGRVRAPASRIALIRIFTLLFTPYWIEVHNGENSFYIATLTTLMIAAHQQGTRSAARWRNTVWALAGLWKQHVCAFGLAFLRIGQRRAVAILAAALLASTAAYFLVWSPDPDTEWARFTENFGATEETGITGGNLGFTALVRDADARLAGGPAVWRMFGTWDVERARVVMGAWLVFVIAVSLAASLRPRLAGTPLPFARHCVLWMAAFFVVYGDIWEHHHVMLLPVLAVALLEARTRGERRFVGLLWALLALPTPAVLMDLGTLEVSPQAFWGTTESLAMHACKALPCVALWGWLAGRAWQMDRPVERG